MRCFCLRAVLALALANFGLSAGCLPADKKWKAGNYLWLFYWICCCYLKWLQRVFLWQGNKIRSSLKHWNHLISTFCLVSLTHSWGKMLVIIFDPLVFSSRNREYCWMLLNRGNLGKTQESGRHKNTKGWWRWRRRGTPHPLGMFDIRLSQSTCKISETETNANRLDLQKKKKILKAFQINQLRQWWGEQNRVDLPSGLWMAQCVRGELWSKDSGPSGLLGCWVYPPFFTKLTTIMTVIS